MDARVTREIDDIVTDISDFFETLSIEHGDAVASEFLALVCARLKVLSEDQILEGEYS